MFHPHGPTFWELAEQCLSSTERGYDLLAPKFDLTPFRTPDEVLDGLAKYLGPPRSIDAALDICCGTGAAIRILRPLVRLSQDTTAGQRHHGRFRQGVVGIDFSHGMLEVARRKFPNRPGEVPVELVHGDVLNMDFREVFDLAVTVGSLGHILRQDEPRFVAAVAAALKPGGRFVFVTTEMPPIWSAGYWLSRGFNTTMHVRNVLKRPPFIMYYLTFLLPQARQLLQDAGFDVLVHAGAFSGRLRPLKVVVGTKRGG
jgi:ubiquinone/menaquinone biosynthesis C-methylase UbiE